MLPSSDPDPEDPTTNADAQPATRPDTDTDTDTDTVPSEQPTPVNHIIPQDRGDGDGDGDEAGDGDGDGDEDGDRDGDRDGAEGEDGDVNLNGDPPGHADSSGHTGGTSADSQQQRSDDSRKSYTRGDESEYDGQWIQERAAVMTSQSEAESEAEAEADAQRNLQHRAQTQAQSHARAHYSDQDQDQDQDANSESRGSELGSRVATPGTDPVLSAPAPAIHPRLPLPRGWLRCRDAHGQVYYHNRHTGMSQWEPPAMQPQPAQQLSPQQQPPQQHMNDLMRQFATAHITPQRPHSQPVPSSHPPVVFQPPITHHAHAQPSPGPDRGPGPSMPQYWAGVPLEAYSNSHAHGDPLPAPAPAPPPPRQSSAPTSGRPRRKSSTNTLNVPNPNPAAVPPALAPTPASAPAPASASASSTGRWSLPAGLVDKLTGRSAMHHNKPGSTQPKSPTQRVNEYLRVEMASTVAGRSALESWLHSFRHLLASVQHSATTLKHHIQNTAQRIQRIQQAQHHLQLYMQRYHTNIIINIQPAAPTTTVFPPLASQPQPQPAYRPGAVPGLGLGAGSGSGSGSMIDTSALVASDREVWDALAHEYTLAVSVCDRLDRYLAYGLVLAEHIRDAQHKLTTQLDVINQAIALDRQCMNTTTKQHTNHNNNNNNGDSKTPTQPNVNPQRVSTKLGTSRRTRLQQAEARSGALAGADVGDIDLTPIPVLATSDHGEQAGTNNTGSSPELVQRLCQYAQQIKDTGFVFSVRVLAVVDSCGETLRECHKQTNLTLRTALQHTAEAKEQLRYLCVVWSSRIPVLLRTESRVKQELSQQYEPIHASQKRYQIRAARQQLYNTTQPKQPHSPATGPGLASLDPVCGGVESELSRVGCAVYSLEHEMEAARNELMFLQQQQHIATQHIHDIQTQENTFRTLLHNGTTSPNFNHKQSRPTTAAAESESENKAPPLSADLVSFGARMGLDVVRVRAQRVHRVAAREERIRVQKVRKARAATEKQKAFQREQEYKMNQEDAGGGGGGGTDTIIINKISATNMMATNLANVSRPLWDQPQHPTRHGFF